MIKTKTIHDWKKMKLLLSPKRKEVLDFCILEPMSIKELAEATNQNTSSVHNHIVKLLKAGYIKLVATRIINGIVEKKYSSVALDFVFKLSKVSDREQMDKDISNAVKKETLDILKSKKEQILVKHHLVTVNNKNYLKIKRKILELEELILSSHKTGGEVCSFILAGGKK